MENRSESGKILLIDDTPINLEVLNVILGSDRHDVLAALNGYDGLELAEKEKPDLILLDVMMPGLDGYEVCARLKANPVTASIPVIFVTAMSSEEDERKGLEVGAIDYVTKPISPPIIRARVKNHLELKKYRDMLENLSLLDGLTGIPNRRRFDEFLEYEWRRAVRAQTPLSILMMDIDYFKKYNDYFGHLAGDVCLRKVAACLAGTVKRTTDLVARYGGEEFAAVLFDTNNEGAEIIAERCRNNVQELELPHTPDAGCEWVTVSIGVATAVPAQNLSPEMLLKTADERLYQAKKQGRNRVVGDKG